MDSFIIGVQFLLAGVFALAGVAKLFDLSGSRQAVTDFGVPERLAPIVAVLLPLVELATAVALLIQPLARGGGVAALVLLLGFSAGIANAMAHGKDVDCGCFGRVYSAVAGSRALVRNLVLAALAGVLVIHGPGPAIDDWVADRTAAELVAIGATVIALMLAGVAFWVWSESRKLRGAGVAPDAPPSPQPLDTGPLFKGRPEGLAVGTKAPAFKLPDLRGKEQTLDSLRARGRPVVLGFIDPGCAACNRLLPKVARWQSTLAESVTVAVIAHGGPQDGAEYWEEHGIFEVLVDESDEVFDSFQLIGTPTAIAVDVDGTVISRPAGGSHMPEILVRQIIRGETSAQGMESGAATSPATLKVEPGTA